jgi:N utilization substance protein B
MHMPENPYEIRLEKGGTPSAPKISQPTPEHLAEAFGYLYSSDAPERHPAPADVTVEDLTTDAPGKGSRRAARHVAMQFIYSWDVVRPTLHELPEFTRAFFEALEHPRETYAFAEELALGTVGKQEEVDNIIATLADNWQFKRIAKVDLAILRLATYEISFRPDIPPVVTINEAIEMSKVFSSAEARRFINGVLDKFLAEVKRPPREALTK